MRSGLIFSIISSMPKASPMSFQYWRVLAFTDWGLSHFSLSNIEFRDVVGGPDLTSPNQPENIIYSSQHDNTNHAVVNAFDSDPNSLWASSSGIAGEFIGWNFQEPVEIVEVALTPRTDGWQTQFVRDGVLQYSEDGIVWVDYLFFTTSPPTLGVTQTIVLPPPAITIDDISSSIIYGINDNQIIIEDISAGVLYGISPSQIIIEDVSAAVIYSGV